MISDIHVLLCYGYLIGFVVGAVFGYRIARDWVR